jgi:aryl-alcohol dehydrogenase-like predicted oxidoreductase
MHPPVVEQCQYNMMNRDRMEREYLPLFERHNMGTTIWSPLAGGILTGKYNDGNIPEGSRVELMYKKGGHLSMRADEYFGEDKKARFSRIATALGELAKELGFTQAQLALAWSVATKDTSTAILGFSRLSQIDENVQAVKLLEQWTPELEKRINEILGNCPVLETDWRTWQTPLPRRLR